MSVETKAAASSDFGSEIGAVEGGVAAPLARSATVSLVEVSPSMEMALKEVRMADFRRGVRAAGVMEQSVQRMPRRVAMLGWIMPAPLVMPARE